jgi:hypothetical protein
VRVETGEGIEKRAKTVARKMKSRPTNPEKTFEKNGVSRFSTHDGLIGRGFGNLSPLYLAVLLLLLP